jgi:hypothetical protein
VPAGPTTLVSLAEQFIDSRAITIQLGWAPPPARINNHIGHHQAMHQFRQTDVAGARAVKLIP